MLEGEIELRLPKMWRHQATRSIHPYRAINLEQVLFLRGESHLCP